MWAFSALKKLGYVSNGNITSLKSLPLENASSDNHPKNQFNLKKNFNVITPSHPLHPLPLKKKFN